MMIYKLSILILLSFQACNNSSAKQMNIVEKDAIRTVQLKAEDNPDSLNQKINLPYDLSDYEEVFALSYKLVEISGLTFRSETHQILANNDEEGIIYFLDPANFEIAQKINFGKRGDYEGIEIVKDIVYVVKSNGNISSYNLAEKKAGNSYKTNLTSTNNIEGLAYDANKNKLLLVTKNNPYVKRTNKKEAKCIYSFDLETKKLDEDPYLEIRKTKLLVNLEKQIIDADLTKAQLKKMKRRVKEFSPSGISIHPLTGDYYILSSIGKTLLVISKNKKESNIYFLDEKFHTQPEGICFSPDGEMYIANEGKSLIAKVYKYKYLSK
jgi:uncharacterized protein YjiK